MKKLLGIVVLGFSLALLNSCGSTSVKTYDVPGAGRVEVAQNNCNWKDETCIWSWYKSQPHSYKIYGTPLKGYGAGSAVFAMSPTSEDRALTIFCNQPYCKTGCKVTHIGINKIKKSKEIELAEKYMPPLLFNKLYSKIKKLEKKVEPEKKKEEDQSVEEKEEKDEEKTERKEADDDWF